MEHSVKFKNFAATMAHEASCAGFLVQAVRRKGYVFGMCSKCKKFLEQYYPTKAS